MEGSNGTLDFEYVSMLVWRVIECSACLDELVVRFVVKTCVVTEPPVSFTAVYLFEGIDTAVIYRKSAFCSLTDRESSFLHTQTH
jgi:hypothetical protein